MMNVVASAIDSVLATMREDERCCGGQTVETYWIALWNPIEAESRGCARTIEHGCTETMPMGSIRVRRIAPFAERASRIPPLFHWGKRSQTGTKEPLFLSKHTLDVKPSSRSTVDTWSKQLTHRSARERKQNISGQQSFSGHRVSAGHSFSGHQSSAVSPTRTLSMCIRGGSRLPASKSVARRTSP